MRILAIETSCDETAISIVDASGGSTRPAFKVLANITLSQAQIHAQYGGVFPMLAKREHAKNLVPVLVQALKDAKLYKIAKVGPSLSHEGRSFAKFEEMLAREPELLEALKTDILPLTPPTIDAIAVTHGPGLEPALWVGVNFARTLALLWDLPLIPVNHMEGHIFGSLVEGTEKKITLAKLAYPALALLVSGGHTELLVVKKLGDYKLLGATRDDAVGEAFDKVARILGLPYPGGPAVSRLAEEARMQGIDAFPLPRPMLKSDDLDFSFAGLKTAVLYAVKKLDRDLTETDTRSIARGFQEAVVDVVAGKVARAAKAHKVRTIIAGGGVASNAQIRAALKAFADTHKITLRIPPLHLTTDNALMIAITASFLAPKKKFANPKTLKARGDLHLGKR